MGGSNPESTGDGEFHSATADGPINAGDHGRFGVRGSLPGPVGAMSGVVIVDARTERVADTAEIRDRWGDGLDGDTKVLRNRLIAGVPAGRLVQGDRPDTVVVAVDRASE